MPSVINSTTTNGVTISPDNSGSLQLATNNGTTAVTIDTSQNVGIGTSSPARKLDVTGTSRITGEALFGNDVQLTVDGYVYTTNGGSGVRAGFLLDGTNQAVRGYTAGSERMRITSGGTLFVDCTDTPNGTNRRGFSVVANTGVNDTTKIQIACTTTSTRALAEFNNSNGNVGSIAVSGSSTSYATSSDYRLKENIAPMAGALNKVSQLKPVTYTWKSDGSNGQGFIAHELQAVVPDAVMGEKDAVDEEGNPKYQGVDTSFLVATLTAAIQELKAELDATKAEVQALKGVK